jgi:hypothetical protein
MPVIVLYIEVIGTKHYLNIICSCMRKLNKVVNTDVMLLYFGGFVFFFLAKDCWPQNHLLQYLSILRPLLHRKGPL